MAIVTRQSKGAPLTNAEIDNNFSELEANSTTGIAYDKWIEQERKWVKNSGTAYTAIQKEIIEGVERIDIDIRQKPEARGWTWTLDRIYNDTTTPSFSTFIKVKDNLVPSTTYTLLPTGSEQPEYYENGTVKITVGHGGLNIHADIYVDHSKFSTDNKSVSTSELVIDAEAVNQINNQTIINEVWDNKFPHALDLCPNFKSKFLAGDDCQIVLLGDSLTAYESDNEVKNPENAPPGLSRNNWAYQFWNKLAKNKPQFDRSDSTINPFTETGAWSRSFTIWDTGYSGEFRGDGSWTRYSDEANANVAWNWNLANYEKLNLYYRKDQNGVSSATIAVTEGNAQVEVYNGTAWVEANGYSFSQKEPAHTEGDGYATSVDKLQLQFRRVATTGSVTITMSKGANADRLFYWGTERWNRGRVSVINLARGGRTVNDLQKVFINDVIDRSPDLILFQLPLINQYGSDRDTAYLTSQNVHDFIWGDRVGFETTFNLKNHTNNFTDIELTVFLPHFRDEHFDVDGYTFLKDWAINGGGMVTGAETAYEAWNRVKKVFQEKGDVKYSDLTSLILREAEQRGWTYKQAFTGTSADSLESFTKDTVHQNDLGHRIWARYITPIFDI